MRCCTTLISALTLTLALASGFGTAAAAPLSSGAAACTSLSTKSSITVLTPSSDPSSYSSAKTSGFNPLNNKLSPSCIVQPTTTADVSTIMKAIFTSNSPYAVRSGGHTGMAGWDSVEGGVLIDFSKMTGFAFDAGESTVSVEPGLRWGEVYERSAEYGVAPMGGRVSHVGTGLILGGGLSLLSPQYGYACDGLVEAEIVSPEGNVLTVNKNTNPSLLRAIKGGGGRFGIVTKYTLRAFPTGTNDEKNWYGGSITSLTPSGMDSMVSLTEKFVATPDDPKATLLSNVGLLKLQGVPTWLGISYVFYKGTKEEFDSVFQDFLAIPAAIVDVKPLSYLEATAVTPLGWTSTQAYKWTGGSLYPNASLTARPLPSAVPAIPVVNADAPSTYLAVWNNIKPFLAKHADAIGSAFFSITPVKTNQIEQGYLAGSNAISPPRGRSYMHWLFSTILEENTDSFPEDLERDRLQLIRENPSDKGLPLFLNEVDASQDAFKTYGWYEGLKQEYKRFDPSGFSVKHQQGPKF